MKKGTKIGLGVFLALIIMILLGFGYLGYLPSVAKVFGWDKPRDLGISYTGQDQASARSKSQLQYDALPANTPDNLSLQRTGSRAVNSSFSSAEVTALMNDRPFKYWPYADVQMKFNSDGSAEVSGRLIKSRVPGYAASIGVDKAVADKVAQYLPPDPVFYVKGKAALIDNKVSLLDPSVVEVGRLNIPVTWILSFSEPNIAFAQDSTGGIQSELSQYSGKRAKIVEYINAHLAGITGFFAKKASFSDNALNFDGNLNEKELTVR